MEHKQLLHSLSAGDSIEIGLSSVVKVNRHENWMSIKVSSRVREGENAQEAHERIQQFVLESFDAQVHGTVDKILEMDS